MSHYAIHIPIDKDTRYFEKYKQKGMSDKEAAYASLIEGMDKSLGDIMDWLEKNGEADNTIILFMGDNGGYATGSHWRDEPLYTQNAPLNCGKGSAYEGGIREPMIVSWPGVTQPSSRCDRYLLAEDYFPTILEMAGITDWKVPQTIDGVSFVPLLKQTGDPSEGRSLYWNCPNLWGEAGPESEQPAASVRANGNSSISTKPDKKSCMIFRLISANSTTWQPAILSRETPVKRSGNFLRSSGGQRPSFKATGKPCPWPDEI